MESFPRWAAKFYKLYPELYLSTFQVAKSRVEEGLPRVVKHLPPRGSKVLDLCCGGGAYLFAMERAGYQMTGLDIQRSAILEARKIRKKMKSKATLLVGDAKEPKFANETFDAVVILGAPFGHFGIGDFEAIANQAYRVLKRKGVMIAEINDHVALFLSGMYQRVLYEPARDGDAVSIHASYNDEEGTFDRIFLGLDMKKKFKGSFHVWTPWILNYVMKKAGFGLKASELGTYGTFSRIKVYRKT
jgi:MPBQ/MSBQ methyltransferase